MVNKQYSYKKYHCFFSSANIKTFLLETSHLFRRTKHDTYFHIFDYLWIDSDNHLKEKLSLGTVTEQFEKYFIKQNFLSDDNVPTNVCCFTLK